jgi:hypothetical protein
MSWPAGSLARSSLFTQATLGPGRRAAQALGSLRHPRPDVADGCVDRQGRDAPGPALPGARRPAAIATTATRRAAPTIYTSLSTAAMTRRWGSFAQVPARNHSFPLELRRTAWPW